MPKLLKYEEDLNKIGKENWKTPSERSDSPSDTPRNSIFTRDINDSSDKRLSAERNHKERVLENFREQETALYKAKEETKDRYDKSELRLFITKVRCSIPFGAIVKLTGIVNSKGKCKVIYEDKGYMVKQEYIRKIW